MNTCHICGKTMLDGYGVCKGCIDNAYTLRLATVPGSYARLAVDGLIQLIETF